MQNEGTRPSRGDAFDVYLEGKPYTLTMTHQYCAQTQTFFGFESGSPA